MCEPFNKASILHILLYFWFQDLFYSLIDTIDGGYSEEIPDIPSYLPGLKRSAYLTSQAQLDSLVRERERERERKRRERESESERKREREGGGERINLIHLPSFIGWSSCSHTR